MDVNAAFDSMVKKGFDSFLQLHPHMGSFLGLRQYDGLLPPGNLRHHMRGRRLFQNLLSEVEAFPQEDLSAGRRIDCGVVIHGMRLVLFEDETLQTWRSMPGGPFMIGALLFHFFAKNFASLDHRLRKLGEYLDAVPRYLEETKQLLQDPVALWVDCGVDSLSGLPAFAELIAATASSSLSEKEAARVRSAASRAKKAFESYRQWLSEDVRPGAREDFAIGPKKIRELIRLRELGMSVEEIVAFGQSQLERCQTRLRELSKKIAPGASVIEVRNRIRSKCPKTFAEAFRHVRESTARARDFVRKSGFATVPPGESLDVMETPEFERHIIPFGAYHAPGRFAENQQGVYLVTPLPDGSERLQEHNYASLTNMSVHEAYPGHHLQLVCANTNSSVARLLGPGTEFVEGWAHYCEERMKDMGFDVTPESLFMQLIDLKWRAARIVIDVRLSSGEMSFDAAVRMLRRHTGFDEPSAVAEVKRYTFTPGYQLSYLVGKKLIKDLHRYARMKMGKHFSSRFFHDTLLGAGSIPMKYMKMELDWKMREALASEN